MPRIRYSVKMSHMTRTEDKTDEELQEKRRLWAERKRRQRAKEPSRHRRGATSRKTAAELLYGPEADPVNLSINARFNTWLPLSEHQRLDNMHVAIGEKLHLDKTQMVTEAMKEYLTKMERLHNKGKPFPIPQPGQGLRKYVNGESEE